MDKAPDIIVDEPIAAPTWLDRLRSRNGFDHQQECIGDRQSPIPTESPYSSGTPLQIPNARVRDKTSPLSDIQCVLSDLFNSGGNHRPLQFTTKAARKQSKPSCIRSEGDYSSFQRLQKEEASLASFATLFSGGECEAKEGEEGNVGIGEDCGLRGFSTSEVTVIDTSCEGWKFEKVLLRRKNVWKVRDLKGLRKSIIKKNKKVTVNGSSENFMKKKEKILGR